MKSLVSEPGLSVIVESLPGHVKSHVHILGPQLHHAFNSFFACFVSKVTNYGLCQPAPQTKLNLWLSPISAKIIILAPACSMCVPAFKSCGNSFSLLGAQNKDIFSASQTFPSSLRLRVRHRLGCTSKRRVLFVSRLQNSRVQFTQNRFSVA